VPVHAHRKKTTAVNVQKFATVALKSAEAWEVLQHKIKIASFKPAFYI
jgi:hypothetical protein